MTNLHTLDGFLGYFCISSRHEVHRQSRCPNFCAHGNAADPCVQRRNQDSDKLNGEEMNHTIRLAFGNKNPGIHMSVELFCAH